MQHATTWPPPFFKGIRRLLPPPQLMDFNVYDLLLEDEKTTINEIVLEPVARKFDIDINDFDYDILGYITTVDGKVRLLQ